MLHDLDRVRGGAAVVGLRLHLGGGVDVHDDDRAGVLGLPRAQLVGGDRVGQRAAGVEVGQQHGLLGAQDRGGLGHEVDAAEGDHVGVGGRRLARQAERVPHEVGHVLDLGHLVVVGEDHRVALLGEGAHLVLQAGDLGGVEGRRRGGRQGGQLDWLHVSSLGRFLIYDRKPMPAKDTTVSDSQSKTRRRRSPTHVTLAVVLQVRDDTLCVLLWERAREPFAAPGRCPAATSGEGDTLERSIRAHLARKVDVAELSWLEQLETLSEPGRHPDEWQLATAYLGLVPLGLDPALPDDTAWHPIERLPELAFDHEAIVLAGRERLAGQALLHEHRLRAGARVVLDLRADRDLHRRARLPGRPDQPAPRARAPRGARGHRRAPPARAARAAGRQRSTASCRAGSR